MPKAKTDTIKASEMLALVKSQGYRCAYSGRSLTPEKATVDHVQPMSRDGENVLANLAIVEAQVNTAKSSMTVDEFLQVCRDVVSHLGGQRELATYEVDVLFGGGAG